jgi:hypothetical protein
MDGIIDLGTELLVDQSVIYDPYLRLLAAAIGQKLIRESPWLAIDKAVARTWYASVKPLGRPKRCAAPIEVEIRR